MLIVKVNFLQEIFKLAVSPKLAGNVDGLLLCWQFIIVCPGLKPIEKLTMKLTTNVEKNSICWILTDNCSNADCYCVKQHSIKPNVSDSFLSRLL
jgi:hypothetical protein